MILGNIFIHIFLIHLPPLYFRYSLPALQRLAVEYQFVIILSITLSIFNLFLAITIQGKKESIFLRRLFIRNFFSGQQWNTNLYESGGKCTSDAECTTYSPSKCLLSEGLCERQ